MSGLGLGVGGVPVPVPAASLVSSKQPPAASALKRTTGRMRGKWTKIGSTPAVKKRKLTDVLKLEDIKLSRYGKLLQVSDQKATSINVGEAGRLKPETEAAADRGRTELGISGGGELTDLKTERCFLTLSEANTDRHVIFGTDKLQNSILVGVITHAKTEAMDKDQATEVEFDAHPSKAAGKDGGLRKQYEKERGMIQAMDEIDPLKAYEFREAFISQIDKDIEDIEKFVVQHPECEADSKQLLEEVKTYREGIVSEKRKMAKSACSDFLEKIKNSFENKLDSNMKGYDKSNLDDSEAMHNTLKEGLDLLKNMKNMLSEGAEADKNSPEVRCLMRLSK